RRLVADEHLVGGGDLERQLGLPHLQPQRRGRGERHPGLGQDVALGVRDQLERQAPLLPGRQRAQLPRQGALLAGGPGLGGGHPQPSRQLDADDDLVHGGGAGVADEERVVGRRAGLGARRAAQRQAHGRLLPAGGGRGGQGRLQGGLGDGRRALRGGGGRSDGERGGRRGRRRGGRGQGA